MNYKFLNVFLSLILCVNVFAMEGPPAPPSVNVTSVAVVPDDQIIATIINSPKFQAAVKEAQEGTRWKGLFSPFPIEFIKEHKSALLEGFIGTVSVVGTLYYLHRSGRLERAADFIKEHPFVSGLAAVGAVSIAGAYGFGPEKPLEWFKKKCNDIPVIRSIGLNWQTAVTTGVLCGIGCLTYLGKKELKRHYDPSLSNARLLSSASFKLDSAAMEEQIKVFNDNSENELRNLVSGISELEENIKKINSEIGKFPESDKKQRSKLEGSLRDSKKMKSDLEREKKKIEDFIFEINSLRDEYVKIAIENMKIVGGDLTQALRKKYLNINFMNGRIGELLNESENNEDCKKLVTAYSGVIEAHTKFNLKIEKFKLFKEGLKLPVEDSSVTIKIPSISLCLPQRIPLITDFSNWLSKKKKEINRGKEEE